MIIDRRRRCWDSSFEFFLLLHMRVKSNLTQHIHKKKLKHCEIREKKEVINFTKCRALSTNDFQHERILEKFCNFNLIFLFRVFFTVFEKKRCYSSQQVSHLCANRSSSYIDMKNSMLDTIFTTTDSTN